MNSKAILEAVQQREREYRIQEEELKELQECYTHAGSPQWHEGGHGNTHHDISDLLIRIEDKKKKHLDSLLSRINAEIKAFDLIKKEPDEIAAAVLMYRFIHGYDWEQVAKEVDMGRSMVFRLASKAYKDLDTLCKS